MHRKVDLQVHNLVDLWTYKLKWPKWVKLLWFCYGINLFYCDGSPNIYSFICKYVYHIITYETLLSLLVKQDFGKLENHSATTLAFYATISHPITPLKIIHLQLAQLICVLCYPIVAHARLKKYIINYKFANKIWVVKNIWRWFTMKYKSNGLNGRRLLDLEIKDEKTKV